MKESKRLIKKKSNIKKPYEKENHFEILKGDCLDQLKKIKTESIHLIVTSPPYNIGKEYETKQNIDHYLNGFDEIIEQMKRVLKENGSICWQVGNYVKDGEVVPLDIKFYPLFEKYGFRLRNRIMWHFGHGLHCKKRFSGRYETILWFTKSKHHYTFNLDDVRIPSKYPNKKHYKGKNKGKLSGNPLGKNPSDVWEIMKNDWENGIFNIPNVKSNHCEKTSHPCQFPIEIVERCILALTNKHEKVLDIFCGSGTSIVASLKHDRYGIGIEKEEQYIQITKNRIEQFKEGTLKMRELCKPVYSKK